MKPFAAVAAALLLLFSDHISAAPRTITATVTVIPLPSTITLSGSGTGTGTPYHGNFSLSHTLGYPTTVTSIRTVYPVANASSSSLIASLPRPRLPELNASVVTPSGSLGNLYATDAEAAADAG